MMATHNLAILLLAAGSSSRMGQSKQLLSIDGKSLLRRVTEVALEPKADCVVVVLGANEALHRQAIQDLPVEIVLNKEWHNGMGSSLKAGLRHALSLTPTWKGLLVMVCDQPYVSAIHLEALIQKFEQTGSSIASAYGNTAGVPALFDSSLFEKLLTIPDEQGAKKIIGEKSVELVDFPKGDVDLDTEEDYLDFLFHRRDAETQRKAQRE